MPADVNNLVQQAAMQGSLGQSAAREVEVLLSANTGPYQEEMKKAASATELLADALHKVEKAYVGTLKFIGRGMIGVGAAMQASATGAAWSAVQFEESFARVAKTTGLENTLGGANNKTSNFLATFGIGQNDLQRFENDIRALSTQIPVSVQELAYLADVAGTLGVESENLVLFAESAANLGAAINEIGSDQAIAGLANLIGAFGDSQESVVNLGSALAELSNHTRGRANEMLAFGERLAGTAVQVGMTSDEVLGLGAAVSSMGAEPQLGASAIVQTLSTMSRAIQTGGRDLDNFARAMGITSNELQSMWSDEGATATLMRLLSVLSGQGEEATVTLQRLGLAGIGTTQVLGGLAAQYSETVRIMQLSDEAYADGTALEELAEVRYDTVIRALKQFRQSTAEVFRSLGQPFLKPMQMVIEFFTKLVNIFNKIPQPIKSLIGAFLGVGGAIITLAGAFTIFFASFHGFFLLLHSTPILLRNLSNRLGAFGASGQAAAASAAAMAGAFERFGRVLTALRLGNLMETLRIGVPHAMRTARWYTTQAATAMSGYWAAAAGPAMRRATGQIMWLATNVFPGFARATGRAGSSVRSFSRAFGGTAAAMGSTAVATAGATRDLNTFSRVLRSSVVAAAGLALTALQPLFALLRRAGSWLVAETFTLMGFALRTMGAQAFAALRFMTPLFALFGKFLLPIALLGAAIWAGKSAWDGYKTSTNEVESSLQRLAEAAGLAYEEMERLTRVVATAGNEEISIAIEGREVIDMLNELDEEGAQLALERYGIQLLLMGNPQDEVRDLIEELGRLTDNPHIFTWTLERLRSEDGIELQHEAARGAMGDFLQSTAGRSQGNWLDDLRRRPNQQWQADFNTALDFMKRSVEGNEAAALAVQNQAQRDLMAAYNAGEINQNTLNWATERLSSEFGQELERSDFMDGLDTLVSNFSALAHATGMGWLLRSSPGQIFGPGDDGVTSLYTGRESRDIIQQYFGFGTEAGPNEAILRTDEGQQIARAIIEASEARRTGRVADLLPDDISDQVYRGGRAAFETALAEGRAFRDLRDEGFVGPVPPSRLDIDRPINMIELERAIEGLDASNIDSVIDSLAALGVEMSKVGIASMELEYDNDLDRRIQEGRLNIPDDGDFRRYMSNLIEVYPHEVGFVQAIEEAETILKRMSEGGNPWSEDADQLRQAIKSWGDEFAQLTVRNLRDELQALPAAEQVQRLTEELRALDMEKGYNVEISVELHQMRGEAYNQAITEFRRVMDQYDSLLERREETTRAHHERMERMEEDHNRNMARMQEDHDKRLQRMQEDLDKAIADARERHADRMEKIDEQEEKQREDRIKRISRAYDVMSRLQARPSAELGNVISNMTMQNEAMREMNQAVEQLVAMGLDEDLIKELGFDDPNNFAAATRLLQGALTDPSMIAEINRLWTERLDLSEAFEDQVDDNEVIEHFQDLREEAQKELDKQIADLKKRYKEQLEETQKAFAESVSRAVEHYNRQREDAAESYNRQLETIADALEKLADRSLESINDLIERASESGLDKLREWAEEIEEIQALIEAGQAALRDPSNILGGGGGGGGNATVMADGGMLPGNAMIRRSGMVVQWAEPETGGEAFIPLSPSKRERSLAIWAETGKILGADVGMMEFADGGFRGLESQAKTVNNQLLSQLGLVRSETKGREPVSYQPDIVQSLVKAIERSSLGRSETNNFGPITVESQDPADMQRKLDRKRRLNRLARSDA